MALGKKTGGRVAGTQNHLTSALKDAILNAFETAGGEGYLVKVAKDDPKTFCVLLGRLVPQQLNATHDLRPGLADLLAQARARTRKA